MTYGKGLLQSKTFLGILAVLPAVIKVVATQFGYGPIVDPILDGVIVPILASIGVPLAIYGRITAQQPITGVVTK